MEDLQAIRRLKRGDIGGLECLIAHYQAKALRAAYLITHDELLSEDAVQEVFVRFQRVARQYDESRPFEPYLLRCVVNEALKLINRRKRELPFPDEDISEVEGILEQAASVEDQAEASLLKRRVVEALAKLPPRQRAAIVQRYYLGLSEKEMAEELEAPPGTVKWLIHAARERLRVLLGSERMAE